MDANILSIVPIVLTIGLAIWTKNVIVSLFTGLFTGVLIISAGQPVTALKATIGEYIIPRLLDSYNAGIIVLLVFIGGFVTLLEKVHAERGQFRDMLLKRGKAFEKAAAEIGLEIVPFDAGFFTSIPCDNPDEICAKLEKQGIFTVPLAKGVRVSVASVAEDKCRELPAKIKAVMDEK